MDKFEIDINLEHIAEQRKKWNDAARAFGDAVDKAMTRLIHEAAAQRMSISYVASKAGFTSHQIKSRMKAMGLNPTTGKTLLSKQAAGVLESNAEVLGIQPAEIDLMSPLAYLPAGPALKDQVSSVTEISDESFLETAIQSLSDRGGVRFHVKGHRYEIRVEELGSDRERWGLSLDSLSLLAQADEVGA